MKKILLLSLVLMLLCWSFASAAQTTQPATSAKDGAQAKVTKVLPKVENPPVAIRDAAPRIEAVQSPNSTSNVGPEAVPEVQKNKVPASKQNAVSPADLQKVAEKKPTSALAPNQLTDTKYHGPALTPNWYSPSMTLDNLLAEGFEGGTLPTGWTDVPGSPYPWVYNSGTDYGPGAPHTGNFAADFNIYDYPTGTEDAIITPSIDFSAHSGAYLLSFWYWHPSGSDYLKIYVSEGGVERELMNPVPNVAAWTQVVIPFASTSTDGKIVFRGHSFYGIYNLYLDDVSIDDAPSNGRCCYGDPTAPSCADNSQSECDALNGSWNPLATCAGNPCPAIPLGDNCAAPIVIGAFPYNDTRNTADFTNDYNSHGNDVVYQFTIAERSLMNFTMCNTASPFDTWLGVWGDGFCGTTTFIAFNDDDGCPASGVLSNITNVILEPGTYYVDAEAYGSTNGTYTLDITAEPAAEGPPNDNCDAAEAIVGPYPVTVVGTNIDAGVDCPGMLDWGGVWYTIDLPYAVNNVSIDYCPTTEAAIQNVGIVWMPDCSCTGYTLWNYSWPTCESGLIQPLLAGTVAGPTTIYFPAWVSSTYPADTPMNFSFTVNVTEVVPPAGDNCDAPIVVNLPASLPYDDLGKTTQGGLDDYRPACLGYYGNGPDVIYQLNVASDMLVSIEMDPSTPSGGFPYGSVSIYAECPPVTCIDYAYASGPVPQIMDNLALAAGTYYVMVDNWAPGPDWINYDLHITEYVPPTADFSVTGPGSWADETQNTCGAGDNCSLRPGSEDQLWEIVLPMDGRWTFSLCASPTTWDSYIYLGTSVCDGSLGYNDDFCGFIGLGQITAPLSAGTYYLDIEGYGATDCGPYTLDVTWQEPCIVTAPPEAVPEGEDACGPDYVDIYNGGCNSNPAIFQDITPGTVIAGTSGNYLFTGSQYRDTDWFQFSPTEGMSVEWKVIAEFPVLLFVIDGTNGCFGTTVTSAVGAECETTYAYANLCPGSTYWFWVGPSVFTGYTCPKNYVAWLTAGEAGEPPVNDLCEGATPLPLSEGAPLTFTGDNTNATTCGDFAPFTAYATVWHGFTIDHCMDVAVDYCGTSPAFGNGWLNLMVDCPGTGTYPAFSFDNTTCGDGNYTIRYHHVPAGTYYYGVMKDPSLGAVGPYTLNITGTDCPPPPANDNCANAEAIGEVEAQPWSTMDATFDGAGDCITAPNIWYLYTASINAPVTVSLCGSTMNDTKLAVYDGSTCPTVGEPQPLQGGEDIANAVVLPSIPGVFEGSTSGNIDDYLPSCPYSSTAPDVVYSYTPSADVAADITLCGSGFDTVLHIRDADGIELACNDDFCGLQSGIEGFAMAAGTTYYIVIDGYGTASGSYLLTVTPLPLPYTMLECNDDFCGLQSQITFQATAGNQYLIEVGGYGTGIGDGIITISIPPAHDVAVTSIDVPRIGQLLDGTAPFDVIATISNLGLNDETFNIVASDDHGFTSTYSGLTLPAGNVQQIAFPNQYNPNTTCADYNFTVTTQLAGDLVPDNDAVAATYRVARPATENFVNDDGTVANGWYFYAEGNLIAVQYTADQEKDIAYLGAQTYVDELGAPWPDATADPFKLYLFLDADLDGYPDMDPVFESTVYPTGVAPSVSYAVLDCGVHVVPGDNFWVAFGEIEDAPAHGSEGIAQDASTDFPLAKWTRLDGTWTQGEYYPGDEMLRAYAADEAALGTISGIAFNNDGVTPLPQVHVVTHNAAEVVVDDQVSSALGTWNVVLPPGTYHEHLSKIGFNDATINNIEVTVGNVTNVSISLTTAGGCHYVVGDANGSATFTGLDVTYSVRYFKGGNPPPYSCLCGATTWYVAGDVNGSCSYSGLDVTYMVRYFKGGAAPIPCPTCPPTPLILIDQPGNGTSGNLAK